MIAKNQRERHRKEGTGTKEVIPGTIPVTYLLATSSLSTNHLSSYESTSTNESGARQSPLLPTGQDLMEKC